MLLVLARRAARPAALAVALAVALAAAPAWAAPVTVTDGSGRPVTVTEAPERIVCLVINCAEELAFIGGPLPVAMGASVREVMAASGLYGDAIEDVVAIPDADGVDLEALAAVEPDLVVGFPDDAPQVEPIAPFYAPNLDAGRIEDLDLFLHDVRALATLLGRAEEVEDRIAATLDRAAAYARLAPGDARFATIYVVDEGQSFWISPSCHLLLRDAVDCTHPGGADWIQSGPELLLAMDPEVLVVDDYEQGEAELIARLTSEDPVWSGLSAAQAGRVHLVDGNLNRMRTIATAGPGLDALMPLLYPEVFPAPLTDAEAAAALQGEP